MKQDDEGYFEPGSLNLPPTLTIEERAQAIGILRQIEEEIAEVSERHFIGAGQDLEAAQQEFVDGLNRDPERMRQWAQLHLPVPITAAKAVADGIDDEGNWRISFDVELQDDEAGPDESATVAIDESLGTDDTSG